MSRGCAKRLSAGAPAIVQNALHLHAAPFVVGHQVVDRPAHILVAALLARLVLIGDVGAVLLALAHEARAKRALMALRFRKTRLTAKCRD